MEWSELTEEEKVYYLAEDMKQGQISPWEISRAWKLLVIFRDIALIQDPSDFDRVIVYSRVLNDLATMMKAIDFPIPPIEEHISAEDIEKLRDKVLSGEYTLEDRGSESPEPPTVGDDGILDLTTWGES